MKELPLNNGYVAFVDDEDFDYLNQWKWTIKRNKNGVIYAHRKEWNKGNQKTIRMHRLVMNAPDGIMVDHKDRDGLNNQKYNLRLATNQQNSQNKNKRNNNTSGYKGVTWHKEAKKFMAQLQITIDGKRKMIGLGLFKDAIDAAKAYDLGAMKYFGEFARLNFPESL